MGKKYITLRRGDFELPEAELVENIMGSYEVIFTEGVDRNSFQKFQWPDSTIREEVDILPLPTEPWTVIKFDGYIPFTLDDFGHWNDPYGIRSHQLVERLWRESHENGTPPRVIRWDE